MNPAFIRIPTPMAWEVVLQRWGNTRLEGASHADPPPRLCPSDTRGRGSLLPSRSSHRPQGSPGSVLSDLPPVRASEKSRGYRLRATRSSLKIAQDPPPASHLFSVISSSFPSRASPRTLPGERCRNKDRGSGDNCLGSEAPRAPGGKQTSPASAGRSGDRLTQAQGAPLPVCLFHGFLFQAIFQGGLVDQEGGVLP